MSVFKACIKKTLQGDNLKLFRSVCSALWSCCLSTREKDAKIISESLDVISRLVGTQCEEIVVLLLGIVEECASVVSSWESRVSTSSNNKLASFIMNRLFPR